MAYCKVGGMECDRFGEAMRDISVLAEESVFDAREATLEACHDGLVLVVLGLAVGGVRSSNCGLLEMDRHPEEVAIHLSELGGSYAVPAHTSGMQPEGEQDA